MSKLVGKLRKPEPNRKKIIIIAVIVAVVCLSASGGLYYMLKGSSEDRQDGFGQRRRQWHDANMPNPDKQNIQEILAYKDSDEFKQLSQREQFMYSMASSRQLREYEMQTYFTLPKEQQTAYLDKLIDQMQAQRKDFEQMRQQMPRRPRPDANDPNMQRRRERAQQAQARRSNPSNMRARSERGTPEQKAQRTQFGEAMDKRMKERGITMPNRGGRGGPGGP
jgi:hypothetical protein